jgi:hypothetical protein
MGITLGGFEMYGIRINIGRHEPAKMWLWVRHPATQAVAAWATEAEAEAQRQMWYGYQPDHYTKVEKIS